MDFAKAPPIYSLVGFLANSMSVFHAMTSSDSSDEPQLNVKAQQFIEKSQVFPKLNEILEADQPQQTLLVVDLLTQFRDETEEIVRKLGARLTSQEQKEKEVERLTKLLEEKETIIKCLDEEHEEMNKEFVTLQDRYVKKIHSLTEESHQRKCVIDCLSEAGAELEKKFEAAQVENKKLSTRLAKANRYSKTPKTQELEQEIKDLKNEMEIHKEASYKRIEHLLDLSQCGLNQLNETIRNQKEEIQKLKESSEEKDKRIAELQKKSAGNSPEDNQEFHNAIQQLERLGKQKVVTVDQQLRRKRLEDVRKVVVQHRLEKEYKFL